MIQILVLLAISWFLVWFFEKKDLNVLGLMVTKDRLKYSIIFLFISALVATLGFLLKIYIAKENYIITPSLTFQSFLVEAWHQCRSVLTEELLFRGALLYLLIKKIGQMKAILFSSFIFALIHWSNSGVWGNFIAMTLVFIFTFAMGLLLAYAYSKTFSILIPFSIHFGWNFTQNYIFPDTPIGNHVFTLAAPSPTVTISYLAFFTLFLLPKILVISTFFLILKKL